MKMFIFSTILWSLTVGLFFGFLFTDSLSGLKRFIITTLIALAIGTSISGLNAAEAKSDSVKWNDGFCPNCGEPWRLVNVEKLRNGSVISYYTCDDCQEIIEIHGISH